MSKVKLTLTIEETLIENAKMIAKNNKKSLSAMVEGYLSHLNLLNMSFSKTSDALELRGIAKSPLSGKTDKEIKEMMYKDKYKI